MKKFLSVFLAICMILALIPAAVSAAPAPLAGDVNGDGKVTPFDALQVQAHLHGELTLTQAQIDTAIAACPAITELSTAHIVAIFFRPLLGQSAQAPEEDGMYHLRSAADFALLRSFPYAAFSLDADIDMSGTSWKPPIFNGYLFGNGHTISNLALTAQNNNVSAGALFVKLGSASNQNAAVQDLTLSTVALTTTATHKYVGLVCGTNYGTISNVSVTGGSIGGTINGTTNYAGTFAGLNYGTVSVSGDADCTISYEATTEGAVGKNEGAGAVSFGGGALDMYYDDHLSAASLGTGTPEISDQTVTSFKVGTSTPDTAVLTCVDGELIAVGTGTATVTFDDATYEVTVSPAPVSLFMIIGHSVGAGYLSDATGSVICTPGTAYSTHESYDLKNPIVPVISDMDLTGYGIGYGSENRVPQIDGFSTTGVRAGDAAIAWRWHQLTGEKAWVLNAGHSGSKLDTWVPGQVDYNHASALFGAAKGVLLAEQTAGHCTLEHTALFYHCNANGDQHYEYDVYSEMYQSMWGGLKQAHGIEAMGVIPFTDKAYANNNVATKGRQANFYMAASADYPDIFLASDDAMQFVSTGTIPAYVASHPILYTAHGGTPAVPTTREDLIYDNCHFKAVGSNYVGIEIAENANLYFSGGVTAQTVRFKDMSTKQMLADNLTELTMQPNEVRYLASYTDNGVSNLTFQTEGNVTWAYPGILTAGENTGNAGSGKLIVKQNGQTVRTLNITIPVQVDEYDLVHVVTGGTPVLNNLTVSEGSAVPQDDGSVLFSQAVTQMDSAVDFAMSQDWTISFAYTRGEATGTRYVLGTGTQIAGLGAGRMFLSIKASGELQLSDLSTEYRYYMTETENLPANFDPTQSHVYTVTNRSGVVSYSIDGQEIGAFTHYNVATNVRNANLQEGSFNLDFTINYVGVKANNGTAPNPFTLQNVQLIPVDTTLQSQLPNLLELLPATEFIPAEQPVEQPVLTETVEP